jgi:hypothetical protein
MDFDAVFSGVKDGSHDNLRKIIAFTDDGAANTT